jgi:enoyl-[acyl-carrier protein] reductase II
MSREMAQLEQGALVTEEDLITFGTGKLRLAAEQGDIRGGSVMGGQISGLIDDIVSCQVLIDRIIATAEERIAILRGFCA